MTDPTLDAARASVRSNVPADHWTTHAAAALASEECVRAVADATCSIGPPDSIGRRFCRVHQRDIWPNEDRCVDGLKAVQSYLAAAIEHLTGGTDAR